MPISMENHRYEEIIDRDCFRTIKGSIVVIIWACICWCFDIDSKRNQEGRGVFYYYSSRMKIGSMAAFDFPIMPGTLLSKNLACGH